MSSCVKFSGFSSMTGLNASLMKNKSWLLKNISGNQGNWNMNMYLLGANRRHVM